MAEGNRAISKYLVIHIVCVHCHFPCSIEFLGVIAMLVENGRTEVRNEPMTVMSIAAESSPPCLNESSWRTQQ